MHCAFWGREHEVLYSLLHLGTNTSPKNERSIQRLLHKPGALRLAEFASLSPKIIDNAIDIVKCLGEIYLWVDGLCIVQNDGRSVKHYLEQMHLIFANSILCGRVESRHPDVY
jgi:hypothetical protein